MLNFAKRIIKKILPESVQFQLKRMFVRKKINIVAVIHLKYTNTFDSIYDECSKNKRFNFIFVLIPSCQPNLNVKVTVSELIEMMNRKHYKYVIGYNENTATYLDIKTLNPDYVFFQTPYDSQRMSELYSMSYAKRFAKVYIISYGFGTVDYELGIYKGMPFIGSGSRDGIFVESSAIAKYLNKFENVHIPVGYLKCDKYISKRGLRLKKANKTFTLAWKPRWLGDKDNSNFLKYIDFFLDLANSSKIHIIFVEHPLLYAQLIKTKAADISYINNLFDRIKSSKNIEIVEDADFLDSIMCADAFVGDYCSTIVEFALTKKPIIYTPLDVALNECALQIFKRFYVVNNKEQLKQTIINLQNGVDPLKDKRDDISLITEMPKHKNIARNVLLYLEKDFLSR